MLLVIVISPAAHSQSLDIYGGDSLHACAGTLPAGGAIPGATGFFYTYKDTNLKHWMYCDPLGNRFWQTGVQVVDYGSGSYTAIVNAKYGAFGSATGWEATQTKRLQAMGFNTVGEYARVYMWAPRGQQPNPIPFITTIGPALYNSVGIKDPFANLPPHWDAVGGYRGYGSIDFYDPLWTSLTTGVGGTLMSCTTAFAITCAAMDASAYLLAVGMDDISRVGEIYSGQGTYVVGISAPWEQFENSYKYGRSQVFSTPTMYIKQQWANWLCGTRYASLAALNTAWGSTYSTCGSSATISGTETIGTGNASATSFTYTFLHTPVDPGSIGISVGGVLQGGDTPWFNSNVCAKTSGNGCIQAATGNINGSNVNYSTGTITVTFSAAPGNGVAITATYQYGGWPKATSGGTGLLDEDGTSSWWPAGYPANRTDFPDPPVGTIPTDMDVFLGISTQQYTRPVHDWIKANLPHHMVSSLNPSGGLIRTQAYNAIANYADVIIESNAALNDGSIQLGGATYNNSAIAQYSSVHTPIYLGIYSTAQPDSQFKGVTCPYNAIICFPTQSVKGVFYQQQANIAWNLTGSDGYAFIIGLDYWQFIDNNSEQGAYGLVSLSDNMYGYPPTCPNKREATNSSITDCYGFTTTPEANNYGNFVNSGVVCGNYIWLGIICNNMALSVPSAGHLP